MTFAQVALQDFPARLWVLDGQAPYVDHTGFGTDVTTPSVVNMFSNPSFQHPTAPMDPWNDNAGGQLSITTSTVRFGTQALAVNPSIENWGYTHGFHNIGLTPGTQYTMSAWVYSQTTQALCLRDYAIGVDGPTVLVAAGTWARLRMTWTPTGANSYLSVRSPSNTMISPIVIDGLMMTVGSTLHDYFDGDSRGAAWSGTPHASVSTGPATYPKHAALIKGASSAVLVGKDNKLNFDAPIMKRGREDQPFSIEVTVRPIRKEASVAQQQIFGTASVMDGLVIAGTVLSFTTKYENTGEARCEFDLQEYRAVTVVAVHTKAKNALYVNGELVSEVEITSEQQADRFAATGESLTSGTTTSGNMLALNGLAVFPHALIEADVDQHYAEAADNMDEFTVGAAYGGWVFALNSATSVPVLEYIYTGDDDWNSGRMSGVVSEYGQIVPQSIGGVSISGSWETIIPLPTATTLSSVVMNWQGRGETVQTSTDGSSWVNANRATKIQSINDGFNTTEKFLYLRVTFPGGIVDDTSYFDELVINMYGPTPTPSLGGRTLTLTNASIENDFDVTEYHENWGVELNSGTLSIAPRPGAEPPRTIQIWAKESIGGTLTDNLRTGATNWYTNDGAYRQEFQDDEWQLRTYVFTNGHSDPITITGTGQVGCILTYPQVLTEQQIRDTYLSYTGTVSTEFVTSGTIGFVDITNDVDIYEYDWSIESAG